VDIKSPRIFRDVGLITRREYQYSPAAQAFVTILKTFFTTPVECEDETPRPAKLARGRQLVGVSSS